MRQEIRNFTMHDGEKSYPCTVPCSVYKTLIENGVIDDPYYRENERKYTAVCERDFSFTADFGYEDGGCERLFLVFEGVDTLSDIYLNGEKILSTDNMHRRCEVEVTDKICAKNSLDVRIHSPNKFISERAAKRSLYGVEHSMDGYQYIRKAHCMFGWDWGPKLPDMGIWRSVYLYGCSGGRVKSAYFKQQHSEGSVTLECAADVEDFGGSCCAELVVTAPDGEKFTAPITDKTAAVTIDDPMLWWVRGLGGQPLYRCEVRLLCGGNVVDTYVQKIGLRTLTISQDKDEWGEEFCFICNGVKVFAMGANYIPEDQIITRCTKERTAKLIEECKSANFNFLRVWGGGYYPDDYFFELCDENGIIVWQDFMFACAAYLATPEFLDTVRAEIADNVIRIRNHPCVGLWCGNNEIESAWEGWGWSGDPEAKADYLHIFEEVIPEILARLDPERFYWPSSPSSGGGFKNSSSNHAGDMHYWDIWHNFKPIEDFRKYHYRFCSEYGFESLPDIKTCRSFAEPEDLELCSNVMQAHQKCTQGNEKLMFYLAQMVNYPYDFERLIYCTQLVQSDCIRSSVEHMRRARGRCMGSAYWQLNDSNPVISWSSIDYFSRRKALHYAAAKFYAPILLSCDDSEQRTPLLYITNDTPKQERLQIICRLRNNAAEILGEFLGEYTVPALSAVAALSVDISEHLQTVEDRRRKYLEYRLIKDGKTISFGTTLFVRPKEFEFKKTDICTKVYKKMDSILIELTSSVFAKSVCLSLEKSDCTFSDNWFDIHGSEPVTVSVCGEGLTAEEVKNQLKIRWY